MGEGSDPTYSWATTGGGLFLQRCESLGPRSSVPGRKDPGFVLQYFLNEAINHFAVFSPNNGLLRGIRYNIQRCD